ncbi:hypothetical protein N0V90_011362 [Kalmusia sp. IMI 367209]|nr:hypothetical protein N0V90_011362 [Kalmusia sp. IMI 367209]
MFDGKVFDQIASAHRYGDAIILSNIVLLVLTTVALAVRLMAKLNTKARFGLDDAFIIIAQTLWYATAGVTLRVVTTAVSILLFYRTIFPVQEFKRIVDLFIGIEVATGISGTMAQVFACKPMSVAWTYPSENMEKCIKYPAFFISILTIELLGDIAILALPIYQITKLKLDVNTRWMLSVVFLLGGISIVSGIVRIQQSIVPGYWFIDLAGDMFWIAIHESTAIIAASLPICRPLVRILISSISSAYQRIYSFGSYVSKYSSSRDYASKGTNGSSNKGSSLGAPYSPYRSKDSGSALSEHSQRELVVRDPCLDTIDRELFILEKRTAKPVEITVQRTYEVV